MKKYLAILWLMICASPSFAVANGDAQASNPVKADKTSDQTVVIVSVPDCSSSTPCYLIKDSAIKLSQAINQDLDESQIRYMIQNSIVPHIDFTFITKYAMGPAWKQTESIGQQQQITDLFKTLLIYQYAMGLSKLRGAQVSIDSSTTISEKPLKIAVKGALKLPTNNGKSTNQPVNIEYDLAKIANNWKVYDVKIENVSIVVTYRSSFNEIVQKKGIDGLIRELQAKVDVISKL